MKQPVMRSSVAIAFLFSLAITQPAGAQTQSAPADSSLSGLWAAAPKITLRGRNVALREALDRWSAASRIRLTYSSEVLPVSRPVDFEYRDAPAGIVLSGLLKGIPVSLHTVGTQVVIGPPTATQMAEAQTPQMLRSVGTLDRVVVTGSTIGASERGFPVAMNVVTGNDLVSRGNGSLSNAIDGSVPGMWIWQQSPLSLLARYGSIRGASSFGLSYPKIYIDGIEAANSLLVTHLDPDAIARVEVIRGPQGAALYGADAISGVINIVTRQEGTEAGAPRLQLRTSAGGAASDYATQNVLEQQHSLSFRAGNGTQSGRFGLTYGSIGPFIPNAFSRTVTANAGGRIVQSRAIYTGTARFFAQDARTPPSPLLADITTNAYVRGAELRNYAYARVPDDTTNLLLPDTNDMQRVRQYTLGGTALFTTESAWSHTATFGIDGYTLKSAAVLNGAFPSAIDSALRASQGNAVRATLRASSVAQLGDGVHTSGTLTFGIEHSVVREETQSSAQFAYNRPSGPGNPPLTDEVTRSNTGFISQFTGSLDNRYYLSAGIRAERNGDITAGSLAFLPMLGGSYVADINGMTLKFRSAYGKGIRPPQTTTRSGTLMGLQRSFAFPLGNEEQAGVEFGADAFLTKNISAHITRFDQTASGLIQPVSVAPPGSSNTGQGRRIAYQLQNVGEIANRGWELEGRVGAGPLSMAATYTNTDSRVEKIALHYTGDLRIGDRMLEVPRHAFGLDLNYSSSRFTSAITYSRVSDWVNYDRIALATAYANTSHNVQEFVGPQLRTYWQRYDTRSDLSFSTGFLIGPITELSFAARHLPNEQFAGPDNISLSEGRTLVAGVALRF